jgi:hypothetical protein
VVRAAAGVPMGRAPLQNSAPSPPVPAHTLGMSRSRGAGRARTAFLGSTLVVAVTSLWSVEWSLVGAHGSDRMSMVGADPVTDPDRPVVLVQRGVRSGQSR